MPRPTKSRLARGVYALPYLSRCGHPMLVAIDRNGWLVTRAIVFARESEAEVAAMLEGVLDNLDP